MADEERCDEVEWTGFARIDPAAVFVVGEVAATAADLARWVRYHRERETGEWDWTHKWWLDVALTGAVLVECAVIVWLAVGR